MSTDDHVDGSEAEGSGSDAAHSVGFTNLGRIDTPDAEQFRTFFEGPFADAVTEFADSYPAHADSLTIDWPALEQFDHSLAVATLEHPIEAIGATWRATKGEAQRALAEDYPHLSKDTPVRLGDLPEGRTVRVGDLRTDHLGRLVAVEGEVTGVTNVDPWVKKASFECRMCGTVTALNQHYGDLFEPNECRGCGGTTRETEFHLQREHSKLVDYQIVFVEPQESNLDNPPDIRVILKSDLVGRVEKGDELTVNGVYETLPMDLQKETQLDVFIEAVGLDVDASVEADKLKESELDGYLLQSIEDLSRETNDFGVHIEDVIDHVHDEYDIREQEVRNRIRGSFVDENQAVRRGGKKLFLDG